MIDTHCHLDQSRFDEDRAHVVERAWSVGLEAIVIPAVAPSTWEPLLADGAREPRLWIGLGIHPQFLPDLPPSEDQRSLHRLDDLLARGGAVAVGECGLDGPSEPAAPRARQLEVLRGHFALARKHELPLLLHCFHAHPALLQLLEEEPLPRAGGVLHSYSGGVDLVKKYARYDLYFSFAGPVTYDKARKPLEALKAVPPERLLAETDAPDQAPTPHRGQRSEPAYLPLILDAMAKTLGESPSELRRRTTENARRLFRARPPRPQTAT